MSGVRPDNRFRLVGFYWRQLGIRTHLRMVTGGQPVNLFYVGAGVIALALLAYLFVALLKPEWFG